MLVESAACHAASFCCHCSPQLPPLLLPSLLPPPQVLAAAPAATHLQHDGSCLVTVSACEVPLSCAPESISHLQVKYPDGDFVSTYIKYMPPGIIMIIVFALAIPGFWFMAVHANRHRLEVSCSDVGFGCDAKGLR